MAFIPPGALVAGTPPDSLPRIADEEMPGEQVILKGFYIDVFPHPNEEGAIPLTNVTQTEANGLCMEQGKRLCTELEWERACKGPDNTGYEYGERYRPEACGTGSTPALRPSGLRVGCRSEFGVRDLHGGVWEWTSSSWGRSSPRQLVTVRGGNAPAGELVGRCANAMGRPAETKAGSVGFRCCAGGQERRGGRFRRGSRRSAVRTRDQHRQETSAAADRALSRGGAQRRRGARISHGPALDLAPDRQRRAGHDGRLLRNRAATRLRNHRGARGTRPAESAGVGFERTLVAGPTHRRTTRATSGCSAVTTSARSAGWSVTCGDASTSDRKSGAFRSRRRRAKTRRRPPSTSLRRACCSRRVALGVDLQHHDLLAPDQALELELGLR